MISARAAAKLGFGVVKAALARELVSTMGAERLELLQPAHDSAALRRALSITSELQGMIDRQATLPLQDFVDVRETLRLAAPLDASVSAERLAEVRRVCRAVRRVRDYFKDGQFSNVVRWTRNLTVLQELEFHIDRVVDRNGEIREDASPELRQIRIKIRQKQHVLRSKTQELLRKAINSGWAAEDQVTVRGGRMVIPIRAEAKRKMRGFIHDTSSTGQTVYLEPALCLDLGNEVRLLKADERREIERILRAATAMVRAKAEAIAGNLEILARLDLAHAKARLAHRLDGVVPTIEEEPFIEIRHGYSPTLLLYTGDKHKVVPLNLTLGGNVRTLVITGPNAGGKTVAMKTVGLLAITLACGIPIPVHPKSRFGLFQHILVEIGDEQSVEHDLSTFSARVSGLKSMSMVSAPGTLLLVDEIGTGTDPAEGAALAQSVIEQFTRSGALTIVTTHHGTLKAFAHEAKGVQNGSLSFDERTLSPTFIFRQGLPGASYAFRIAERMELSAEITSRARQLLGRQGTSLEELMVTFERLNSRLEERLANANALQSKLHDDGKAQQSRQRVTRKPGRAQPPPKAKLTTGQWVHVDGGTSPVEILELDGWRATVAFGNMRMQVNVERLTPAQEPPRASKGRNVVGSPQFKLDVRGYRAADAVAAVEKFIDQGVGASLRSMEIVHGTGTGALREAIHAYLEGVDHIKAYDSATANPGLTRVILG